MKHTKGLRMMPRVSRFTMAFLLAMVCQVTCATTYYWDADGSGPVTAGGAGIWDADSSLWRPGATNGTLQVWPNADPNSDTAVFSGTAGTVALNSLSEVINVSTMSFSVANFVIDTNASGTATLNLSGAKPAIVGTGNTTIKAKLTGGSLTIANSALALMGNNTYSGGTMVNSGLLVIGHTNALGTGPLVLNGGNVSGYSGLSGLVTNALILSNNVTLSNHLFPGYGSGVTFSGPVTLTSNRTITITILYFGMSGLISDGGNGYQLTCSSGNLYGNSLTLSGANTFSGGVVLNGGTTYGALNFGNMAAPGTGTFTINGGKFDNTSASAGTLVNNNTQIWNAANFIFGGTKSLNMGMGAVTLGTNVNVTVLANTLTVGGPIRGSNAWYSLTKSGAGELVLGGANTYTGGTTVTSGRLTVNASGALAKGDVYVWTNGVLAIQNGNAVAPTATLTLATNWPSCYVVLSNSTPNVIAKLIVGTNTYTHPGTYGSTNSTSIAQFKIAASLTGNGLLKIAALPGTAVFFR